MTRHPLFFEQAPELTDQATIDILAFLYELLTAFENKYYAQLARYDQQRESEWRELQSEHQEKQLDLFADFDDELPDF